MSPLHKCRSKSASQNNFENLPAQSPNSVREILRPFNEVESTSGKAVTVITTSENQLVQRALEHLVGVDVLTLPTQTTVNARQTRFEVTEHSSLITDPPFTAPGKSPKATWSR